MRDKSSMIIHPTHSIVTWRSRDPVTMVRGERRAFIRARELAESTGQSLEVWRLARGLRSEKRGVVHPAVCVATVVLVGCAKQKRTERVTAAEMYSPSPLFRKQLAVARQEVRSTRIFVVSAKHGLMTLRRKIAPYEHRLQDKTRDERREWADWIIDDLYDRMSCWFYEDGWEHKRETTPLRAINIVLMMGNEYARPLRAAVPDDWTFVEPLAGMQIGERLRWLNRAIRRAKKGQAKA
jgi:hypothetical protein